jgi:hypothetical protein
MSQYGVKCEELAKRLAQLISDADAAGIADVDILDALQMARDDFDENQMQIERAGKFEAFVERLGSVITDAEKDGLSPNSIHNGFEMVMHQLAQQSPTAKDGPTRPWMAKQAADNRAASAARPWTPKEYVDGLMKAYGKKVG